MCESGSSDPNNDEDRHSDFCRPCQLWRNGYGTTTERRWKKRGVYSLTATTRTHQQVNVVHQGTAVICAPVPLDDAQVEAPHEELDSSQTLKTGNFTPIRARQIVERSTMEGCLGNGGQSVTPMSSRGMCW
jgi:hypothetical protein